MRAIGRHLCLPAHLRTHQLPTHRRSPGRSRKSSSPHAILQGVLGTVGTWWSGWEWGICVLGLELPQWAGVLWGRGTSSLGPCTLPTLPLAPVGARLWGRVSVLSLRRPRPRPPARPTDQAQRPIPAGAWRTSGSQTFCIRSARRPAGRRGRPGRGWGGPPGPGSCLQGQA